MQGIVANTYNMVKQIYIFFLSKPYNYFNYNKKYNLIQENKTVSLVNGYGIKMVTKRVKVRQNTLCQICLEFGLKAEEDKIIVPNNNRQVEKVLVSVHILVGEGNVQEEVLVVVFLVQGAHSGRCRGNDVVYEEEQSIFRPQVDSLADQEVELANGKVGGNQVFLLIKVAQSRLGSLLDNDRDAIGVFTANLLALRLPLLEGVFFLVQELHFLQDLHENFTCIFSPKLLLRLCFSVFIQW